MLNGIEGARRRREEDETERFQMLSSMAGEEGSPYRSVEREKIELRGKEGMEGERCLSRPLLLRLPSSHPPPPPVFTCLMPSPVSLFFFFLSSRQAVKVV